MEHVTGATVATSRIKQTGDVNLVWLAVNNAHLRTIRFVINVSMASMLTEMANVGSAHSDAIAVGLKVYATNIRRDSLSSKDRLLDAELDASNAITLTHNLAHCQPLAICLTILLVKSANQAVPNAVILTPAHNADKH